MLKLSGFFLVLVVGQVCGVPLAAEIGDEAEIVEVNTNTLTNESQYLEDVIDLSFYGDALFGEPDDQYTARMVANYTLEASNVNPEELGIYLEGDILIPKQQMLMMKNGITSQSSRWPNGIVPYEIRGNFNSRDMFIIENAIREYHRRTCIRFVRRSQERNYISIVSGKSGCWSSVGRVGGRQEVNLQSPGCLTKPGTAIHELMHALGFLHEQNREERDSFVAIQYQNIKPTTKVNFNRATKTFNFGVPYDYGSVMHYSAYAFSSNGQPTILAKKNLRVGKMGQRDGFSAFDVEKINKMYRCGYNSPSASSVQGLDNILINSFYSGILTGLNSDVKPSS